MLPRRDLQAELLQVLPMNTYQSKKSVIEVHEVRAYKKIVNELCY